MLHEEYLFADRDYPALVSEENKGLVIDSHGSIIYGRILLPALRRAGIAAAYFSYRGVWGGYGDYCLSHLIEDLFRFCSTCRTMRKNTGSMWSGCTWWVTAWEASPP